MAVRKLRSKIFLVLLSVVSLLVLVVAALPLWFPWALRPIAKRYGATYTDYQRLGYQRFQLSNVVFTNGPTHVQAQQVTGFVPTVWLWRHWTGARGQQFANVRSWQYTAISQTKSSHTNAPISVHTIFHTLQTVAATLQNWLPTAKLIDGSVSVQNQVIKIPEATWTNGNLTATLSLSNQPPVVVVAATAPSAPWKLHIDSDVHQLHAEFSLTNRADKLDAAGAIDWMTNHVNIAATFPSHGFIPETASVRADAFHVRGNLLRPSQTTDLRGALRANWQSNRF